MEGIHLRSRHRRSRRRDGHQGWLPRRRQDLRRRVLRDVAQRGRQCRPAAAPRAGTDLGSARARAHPGQLGQGPPGRRLHRQLVQRLPAHRRQRSGRAPLRTHRHLHRHRRQPRVVLLRLPRAVDRRRHCLLVVPRGRPPGSAQPAHRRIRSRRRRRGQHAARPADHRGLRSDRCPRSRRPDQGLLLRRQRHDSLRGRRPRRAQATRGRRARRRSGARCHRRIRHQPGRPLQRTPRAEPRCTGRRTAIRVPRRRHQPVGRGLHRSARHRNHPGRSHRGRRARPRGRPWPRRGQAGTARLGEDQLRTPRICRRRSRFDQGRAGDAGEQTPGVTELRGPQPVHRLRQSTPEGHPGGHRLAAVHRQGRRRHLRFRLRRHQRPRRRTRVRTG
ncbi:unannotated protein [freshwater metagenome]|uniref:Unannotated protein n=1 Tax=freshwater metagenome TaxID=449393 RepID=A0A6J7HM35_9ZZZZ